MAGGDEMLWAEFFAGGGMARAGLGAGWRCALANDIDPAKGRAYARNWGADHLRVADVATLSPDDLPAPLALAWASSPCQNLSLAGGRAGLSADRSAAFWPWWRLMRRLAEAGRPPRVIAFENVVGLLTSGRGADFAAMAAAFAEGGYRLGAMVIDAGRFVPQSRPRLFVVAHRADRPAPEGLAGAGPCPDWTPPALAAAVAALPDAARDAWTWWRPPAPPARNAALADLLEPDAAAPWRPRAETERLMSLMAPRHLARVAEAQSEGVRRVATVYRRTRPDSSGGRVQRAEVRFDGVAGCLRTPAGGSSRQTLLVVEGPSVRSRLLTPREGARLMGLPDTYALPASTSAALKLLGDGVAAPVAAHLSRWLLRPLAADAG
jgi:DNA (cytosine-5)-methyltransferase 1